MSKRIYKLILVIFLLASNAVTFYFLESEEIKKKDFKENYYLLDPARVIYNSEDLIVNVQQLREQLEKIGKDSDVSIYFELLNTGANISINKDLHVWPASLMKIPIAMAAMKKVESEEWAMNKDFILKNEDKNPIFSTLYAEPTGTHLKLSVLLDKLLISSDNTARNILVKELSEQELIDVLDYLGIEFEYKNDAQITAKRYSIFWRSFFFSTYLKPENSQKLIEIMTRSSAVDFLAKGIPGDVKFSHKIGVLYDENFYADSGIVYLPNRPYILTVMIKNHTQEEAKNIMRDVSEKIYKCISEHRD